MAGRGAGAGAHGDKDEYVFKLVLIGNAGVGKTCLLTRFADKDFKPTAPSVGVDFRIRTVDVDGASVKLQIWDTVGQESYGAITRAFYRGADGIIFAYDVTNRKSFERVRKWLENVVSSGAGDTQKLLVGNKVDLPDITIPTSEGKQLSSELGMAFVETSAKTALGVDDAFILLAQMLVKSSKKKGGPKPGAPGGGGGGAGGGGAGGGAGVISGDSLGGGTTRGGGTGGSGDGPCSC